MSEQVKTQDEVNSMYLVTTYTDEAGREIQVLTPINEDASHIGERKFLAKISTLRMMILPKIGPIVMKDEIRLPLDDAHTLQDAFDKHDAAVKTFEITQKEQAEARDKVVAEHPKLLVPRPHKSAGLITPQ